MSQEEPEIRRVAEGTVVARLAMIAAMIVAPYRVEHGEKKSMDVATLVLVVVQVRIGERLSRRHVERFLLDEKIEHENETIQRRVGVENAEHGRVKNAARRSRARRATGTGRRCNRAMSGKLSEAER